MSLWKGERKGGGKEGGDVEGGEEIRAGGEGMHTLRGCRLYWDPLCGSCHLQPSHPFSLSPSSPRRLRLAHAFPLPAVLSAFSHAPLQCCSAAVLAGSH